MSQELIGIVRKVLNFAVEGFRYMFNILKLKNLMNEQDAMITMNDIIGFDDITSDSRLWAVRYEGDEDNIIIDADSFIDYLAETN